MVEVSQGDCSENGIDDVDSDCEGAVDCDDTDCADADACVAPGIPIPGLGACAP